MSSNINFDVVWRPFQLNPNIPVEGIDRKEYLKKKFGSQKNAKSIYDQIEEVGLKNNIFFQFEKIKKTPNTFMSHKLLALAHKFKIQTLVLEDLFYAFFIEGIDIGNKNELIKIAKRHKILNDKTYEYLDSDEDKANLLKEQEQANNFNIKGVPCFIINKKFVLFGAQNSSNFLSLFEKIIK